MAHDVLEAARRSTTERPIVTKDQAYAKSNSNLSDEPFQVCRCRCGSGMFDAARRPPSRDCKIELAIMDRRA